MIADPVVAFLYTALDETERVARAATGSRDDGVWTTGCEHDLSDPPPSHDMCCNVYGDNIRIYDEGGHDPGQARHIALHDPRAALARVQAERAVLASYDHADWEYRRQDRGASPDYLSGQLAGAYAAVLDLAYGHRHTIPGFDPAWAPEGVSADA